MAVFHYRDPPVGQMDHCWCMARVFGRCYRLSEGRPQTPVLTPPTSARTSALCRRRDIEGQRLVSGPLVGSRSCRTRQARGVLAYSMAAEPISIDIRQRILGLPP